MLVNYADIIWKLVEKILNEEGKEKNETDDQKRDEQD